MTEIWKQNVAASPRTPEAAFAEAVQLYRNNRPGDAEPLLRGLLSAQPDHPAATHLLGNVLAAGGRLHDALPVLQRATELQPRAPWPHLDFARACLAAGVLDHGVPALKRAATLAKGDFAVINMFSQSVQPVVFHNADPEMADLIAMAITTPGIDAHYLHRPLVSLLEKEADIAALLAADEDTVRAAWTDNGLSALTSRAPVLILIERLMPAHTGFERLMGMIRKVVMESVMADDGLNVSSIDKKRLPLIAALARQCHGNEFLFPADAAELEISDAVRARLDERLADKPGTDKKTTALIALAGLYAPLHTLPHADHLAKLGRRIKDTALAELVKNYVVAPLREKEIIPALEALTPIDDAESQNVREQYEESPYPRWFDPPTGHLDPLYRYLQATIPALAAPDQPLPAPQHALIGGCGSGRQAFILSRQLPDAHILAVDLSRASLAHAVRWQEHLAKPKIGQNVDFRHGDILNLGCLEQRFQVVESYGVLHHMADPMAGWRVLADLTEPGGLMHIALYSELARTAVVEARDYIAEHGFSDSLEDIKRFRQDVIAMPESHPIRQALVNNREFYSVSSLRDLVFHRCEHRFTIPQLQTCLADLGLSFCGFAGLHGRVVESYRQRFPDDPLRTNLDNWHAFEQDNPSTFANTYDMWLRKNG